MFSCPISESRMKEEEEECVCVCEGEKASGKVGNVNVSGGEGKKRENTLIVQGAPGATHMHNTHLHVCLFSHICSHTHHTERCSF